MANKSDYRDPRTNLFELLPNVLRSQTNEAVFEDVFNRYLSSPEIELVDGYVGAPLTNATVDRQIQEPTACRQAFQLQPLLSAKLGTVHHLASYDDILNELGRTGIDDCRLPLWGNALQFNWIPPIDIDKFVNFRDYYWYCPTDPGAAPQYLTIENLCNKATQRVEAYQVTLDTFGDEFDIVGLNTAAQTIFIQGDLTQVFTEGFVFFVRESTNVSINDSFFTVSSSTYNEINDITVITVDEAITDDSIVDGLVSIFELMFALQASANCFCGQDVGWDMALWDDNQIGDVLWTGGSPNLLNTISAATEAAWKAQNPGLVTGSPEVVTQFSIWYDTTNNQLKQASGGGSPEWVVVQNNFSAIVALVDGTHRWDLTTSCVLESNPWSDQNKWFHKNHIPNFTIAKQATIPIIEYDFDVQLNQWNFTNFVWEYRTSEFEDFAVTTDVDGNRVKPTLNELVPFRYVIGGDGADTITLSPSHGDRTVDILDGDQFRIIDDALAPANNGVYTVVSSTYDTTDTAGSPQSANVLATIITTTPGAFAVANQSNDSCAGSPTTFGSGGKFTPQRTSINNDVFRSYNEHWLLIDQEVLPVPAPEQPPNTFADIDPIIPAVVQPIGGSPELITSYQISTPIDICDSFGIAPYLYAMEYTVQEDIPAGINFPLEPRMVSGSKVGDNNIRVFIDGVQQYGTYLERDDITPTDFVDGIEFPFPITQFQIVTIKQSEASLIDTGRNLVPVRTVRDDAAYALAAGSPQVPVGSPPMVQPIDLNIIEYRFANQSKTLVNQYPLFDMFECDGDPLFQVSPLFQYKEDQTYPILPEIGKRVVVSDTGDYAYQQHLIDPTTAPQPVIYAYQLGSELQTVWRKGLNDEEYVPEYADENRDPIAVGNPDGCWEIPDQLYFNTEHENRECVNFSDLLTHFRTILGEQNNLPGFIVPGNQAYLLEEVNYGLGGRIKEYNDSYDTFLSSAFVNNITPLGVLDFAHDQYENSLNTIKELYRSNITDFLASTDSLSINALQSTVTNFVINSYETNDFFALVYGDSNTFIQGSPETGVKNWPATLPFVELGFKHQPYILNDDSMDDFKQLVHHDGHRSNPSLTATTRESIIQITINTPDPRTGGTLNLGMQVSTAFGSPLQPTTPPDDYSVLSAVTTPRSGIYWYDTGDPTNRVLYRFNVSEVGTVAPTSVPVGALWYDTSTDTLMELQGTLLWEAVETAGGSPDIGNGIITQAWVEIDLDDILINTLLEVEQRLYEAAPTLTEVSFDVDTLLTDDISCPTRSTTVTEADTGAAYYEEAFGNFLRDRDIADPYDAEQYYDASDPFTWNYTFSTPIIPPVPAAAFGLGGSPVQVPSGGWWLDLYQNLYGTPYPHLEPWKLHGYEDKPTWWDATWLNDDPATYGTRRWKYIHRCAGSPCTVTAGGSPLASGGVGFNFGMWEDVRRGIVPVGELLPDGVTVSTGAAGEALRWGVTWTYFSVNIDDVAVDGFEPDEVFPPFWDFTAFPTSGSSLNRSVFSSFAGEIVLPSADYTFETGAPVWFEWTQTSQLLYDNLTVAYRLQPVRFMHFTFGVDFLEVGSKQINLDTCKVYAHKDVEFYGDIVNTNEVLIIRGINQWYVNFNRFSGFDTSSSDFRPLWQTWEPLLTYQFGSIIDTQTFQINNSNFDINERDYEIVLKRSPGIEDYFLDAFKVTVVESPNTLAGIDTQSFWKFNVDTYFPETRTITYYEVHNYPVYTDTTLNTLTVYQYAVEDVAAIAGNFILSGNQTDAFTTSFAFTITGSTGNDGSYTATSVAFDPITDTTIVMTGSALPSAVVDGALTTTYRTHPWETGDKIELTSTQTVPSPLRANTVYYVIKIDDVSFQLAATAADATTATPINLSSVGFGNVSAGQVFSKFVALNGAATNREWNHFVIDTRFTRSFIPPEPMTGIQTIINMIDGYSVITSEEGWNINFERLERDPETEEPITWQYETERFIDQAFRLPQQRSRLPDSFGITVDPVTNTFTFGSLFPLWTTGTKIQFSSLVGLPAPLLPNQTYFLIRDSETEFRIALNSTSALLENELDIIGGVGTEFAVFQSITPIDRHPALEINPFRNNVWIQSPQGILSNVITGPSMDIRNTQLITTQNGDQMTGEQLSVFRWDKVSRVFIPEPIRNPEVALVNTTPYNSLHMAGMHLFFDGYECVILFNDRSVEDVLIYDPFVGLNTARFFMQFFRQEEFTQRPTVGGYFLTPDDEILRNIESGVKDLENLYDTFRVLETTDLIKEGRKSLGYGGPGSLSYLDAIGLNPKSQFLFWRGMIQSKGSVNAIDAFTNNTLFEEAIVDEYWAYKIAEYGSNYQQEYPALNLIVEDSQRSEKRFEFLAPGQSVGAADTTFEGILTTNQDRWHNQPDVLVNLADNNLSMYFDAEVTNTQTFTTVTVAGSPAGWYYESDVPFDDVTILQVTPPSTLLAELVEGPDYTVVNSKLIRFATDPALVLAGSPTSEYRLYTINPAEDKINPTKVIDFKDDIVITEVPVWDPAKDHQSYNANNIVTFENTDDPASYTNALDITETDSEFWNKPEVDITWWDTSERGYLPYSDHNIFALDDRIQNWGKLADWSSVKLYQWTESNIPPSEWDAVAAQEELNISIDSQIRKSGRVRTETSQRERTALDIVTVYPSTHPGLGSPLVPVANCILISDPTDRLVLSDRIVFTSDDELPLPLEAGTFYYIVSLSDGGVGSPSIRNIKVSLTEGGTVLDITPGPIFIDVSGNSFDTGSPAGTGLLNDFDTSGIQDTTFSTAKSLGSNTGLTTGTSGFQNVEFGSPSVPVGPGTATNLSSGGNGSQLISFTPAGSPSSFVCSDDTGLAGSTLYGFTVTIDGGIPQNAFVFTTPGTTTFAQLAAQMSTAISGGTAACSASGITVTSSTSGPASTVDVVNVTGFGALLFSSITFAFTINGAISGSNAPDFDASIVIDGGAAQTIEVNGSDAQTFTGLLAEINNDLAGGTATIESGILTITSNSTGTNSTVGITDNDLFSSVLVGAGSPLFPGAPGPSQTGTGVTYQSAVSVNNGGQQIITITGDEAQTYAQLIAILNLNITGATSQLTLAGSPTLSVIRLASDSTGVGSTIDIIDPAGGTFAGIFESLIDTGGSPAQPKIQTPVDGVDATSYEASIDLGNGARLVNVVGNEAQLFSQLIDLINAQLTSGFIATTPSGDLQITAGNNTVTVIDGPGINLPLFSSLNGYVDPLIPLDTGEGNHQAVPPFSDQGWIQLETIKKEMISARDKNNSDQFDLSVAGTAPNNIVAGDVVDIYKNGFLLSSGVTVGTSGLTTITGTAPQDFVTAIKPKHVLTAAETAFDPDVFDDGTNLIQYKEDTNFSQTSTVDSFGRQVPVYYFWVENKTTRQNGNVSMRQAVIELENTPTPYTIFDKLTDETFGGSPTVFLAPQRYTQLIVRGLAGIVNDTDRYELRFTRDFTLRDELNTRNYTTDLPAAFSRVDQEPLDLKTLYTEWTLIREKQPFNIPRTLWDKITEAIVARKLDDATVRVPALSRELYDITYDAQTQYGLRDGQAFVNGELALATILDDLEDPNNDFQPVDINVFFDTHDFTTEAGIIDAMEDIYNTFPFEAVNRLYFEVLLDALTTKAKYPDIFKTSWVSLSGTQVFQTEALFSG